MPRGSELPLGSLKLDVGLSEIDSGLRTLDRRDSPGLDALANRGMNSLGQGSGLPRGLEALLRGKRVYKVEPHPRDDLHTGDFVVPTGEIAAGAGESDPPLAL